MANFEMNPNELLQPKFYPKLAQDIQECQVYLTGEQGYLESQDHSAYNLTLKQKDARERIERQVKLKNTLESNILSMEHRITIEKDPVEKAELEADLMRDRGRLQKVNIQLEKGEGESALEMAHNSGEAKMLEVYVKAYRQSVLDYINDYVVPGNLGEGTVTFEGVEYVAALATQE
ncbi:hypothetical protein FUAX_03460 [Fulvitalea axinellae]|uniref:Uncharacterized protein n=1 Tax=Fulvitalea axinellae TaxID=1182444 RepID=A0AAU9CNJ0_9BACT|nr:hypothetical protein FUAX_03460 [Fulvitalea axinellae]